MRFALFVVLFVATMIFYSPALAEQTEFDPSAGAAPAYSVQLVPFASPTEADLKCANLEQKGYRPYLHKGYDSHGVPWYAVRVADYATAAQARQALSEFKRTENLPAFVTRQESIVPLSDVPRSAAAPPIEANTSANVSSVAGSELDVLKQQILALQKKMEDLEKESEARKILKISEEEQSEKETEVLTAAGQEYSLIPSNTLGFEYGLEYSYFSADVLLDLRNSGGNRLAVERRGNHIFANTLFAEYGLLNNLSLNGTLPFIYKYDKRSVDDDRDVTDLGDMSLGLQYQPFKAAAAWPTVIFLLNGSFPTGRSPYKIDPEQELATGNGYYAMGGGLTLSKTVDPVVLFGSLNYTHGFKTSSPNQRQADGRILDEVEPGDSMGLSMGMAFAFSHKVSLNLSYNYTYHLESRYLFQDGGDVESNSWVTSSFNIGAGLRLSPRFSVYLRTEIGLTSDDPDFSFSVRIPVRFALGD
ncbi:MAG: hypothetical protein VR64_02910 [Desulfatitalea sp. BRH_c12]|nr:MAG: hypothetical protein VR64_02910 [Desulfatitalea sp. BRH_c12]